jgi:hypothetical protein
VAFAQPLTYGWIDFHGQNQAVTFDIPSQRLRYGMLSAKDQVGLEQVQAKAYDLALTLTRASSTSDVIYGVTGTTKRFDIAVQAPTGLLNEAMIKRNQIWHAVVQSISDPSNHSYFIFDESSGGIRPDYQAVADDNRDVFKVVSEAFIERFSPDDPVELINQLLAFLQAITFDDLLAEPFPMSPPIPMIIERRGDCEGKQTFLVGVLGQLFKDRNLFLINLPSSEHIIAGIELDSPYINSIEHNGHRIVLMDATGPDPYAFGSIAPQFQNYNNKWVWNEFQH